jgi:hypothetical protein
MNNHYRQIPACDTSSWSDHTTSNARPLTHDEQKAAEAAFRQQPFNPVWSQAALAIYVGITAAMGQTNVPAPVPSVLNGHQVHDALELRCLSYRQ